MNNQKNKDIEKQLLIKKAITSFDKQIAKLEEQKAAYLTAAKKAIQNNYTNQANLAISACKISIMQLRRITEMKINLELVSLIKDSARLTVAFLDGMKVLSKEMSNMVNSKEFKKVQKLFEKAMMSVTDQSKKLEISLNMNNELFKNIETTSAFEIEDEEIKSMLINEIAADESNEFEKTDAELKQLQKSLKGKI